MTVVSGAFLLFQIITLCVFYAVPQKHRWLALLAASVAFYVLASRWQFLPCILGTSLLVWYGARVISRIDARQKERLKDKSLDRTEKKRLRAEGKASKRKVLVAILVACIGVLCVTKFSRTVVGMLDDLSRAYQDGQRVTAEWLVMPLGISYYTFSTVGYLLDVYWNRYACEDNFLRFFLYAIYYPHILQGPISRYSHLGRELKRDLVFNDRNLVHGAQLMTYGFFKKLVIADRLNLFVVTAYDGNPHAGSVFLTAMVLDALMIYMDFSGYMDIVKGASQMFGVDLEDNFNHPFFSRNVAEFWRRWHMSLGSWFKDYVYYPISVASWMKKINKYNKGHFSKRFTRVVGVAIPCMITWFLTGLWHGTGINYVCWGLYYGTLITISNAFTEEFKNLDARLGINVESRVWTLIQRLRTFGIFMGGRVLTSPGTLANTAMVFDNIFHNLQMWQWFDESIWSYGLTRKDGTLLICALLVVLIISSLQERMEVREWLDNHSLILRWGLMYAGIIVVIIFGIYGAGYDAARFIYMQY